MTFQPISISLSPNTEKDDIQLALKLLFQLWRWKISANQRLNQRESAVQELEEEFKKYLGVKYAISFNSGRSALMAILNSLGLNKGDEVLLQAFTCNAAVNPILWSGFKPVYVDVNENNFNIDIDDLKRKITSRSKAVIIQHTFGLPAEMDEIIKICEENNLILIEDCAHALGAKYKGRLVGAFGKAAFFSFSRDKIISSVYGGIAVTNDEEVAQKLEKYVSEVGLPSMWWIFQQLLHPVLMNWIILPTYQILGKYLLVLFQWLQILSKAVHWKEKRGKRPGYFPKRLPNALAILALNQFKKLERFNNHRKELSSFYRKELSSFSFFELPPEIEQIYLRFTIKHPRAHEIIKKAWQENILIGDWYTSPIAPHDTKLDKMQYILGSCPKAERLSKETFNLPTHINISKEEAQKIVNFLKQVDEVYPLRGFPSSSSSSTRAEAKGQEEIYFFARKAELDMEVREIKNKETWENFLLGCEEKTFLSSWNWGEFNQLMGNKIWRLGVFECLTYDVKHLVAVALVIKVMAKRGTFLLIPHGPVGKKDGLDTLLEELKRIGREEKASFIRINSIWQRNGENNKIFKDLGFREAPIHSHPEDSWKLDIRPSEEELLSQMRKTTRYLIRQAQKNKDIEIYQSNEIGDLEIFNKLNQEIAEKQKFIPFSFEYLKNEFSAFERDNQPIRQAQGCPECTEGQTSLFFGKYKGEVIAGAFILFWSNIGFYHHAALLPRYHKIPVAYSLQWEAIKEAKKRGCLLYDFWGYVNPETQPRHPWAGPTLFKMGFGGRAFEYVKTQDLPLSQKYWLTFLFEKLRKGKRGL